MMQAAIIDRTKEWTVDDYLLLGEVKTPCELINGELIMSPSPTPYHQLISGNLYDLLKSEAKKLGGLVFYSPMDLYIDQKNVFQPDLIYISKENKNIISNRGIEGVPELVVEIISRSNIFIDRNIKKKAYQKLGVGEYWIIDPANQTMEIYLSSQTNPDVPHLFIVESGQVNSTVLPELSFDLKEIF